MPNRCENCIFWFVFECFNSKDDTIKQLNGKLKKSGFCKRFPPQRFYDEHTVFKYSQRFPEMEYDEWCGEHKEK